jgi:anion-transporting  ArsA/GET3 family ATPase
MTLADLLAERSVVVCTGTGGVGKTTTAAALGMAAARLGRRAVVVTVDPARRLADAMGGRGLSNEPSEVPGPWPGQLWAVMLDTAATFDDLVARYASGPEQVERILANRFYRNIAGTLSGTHEYMAAEKLYELHASDRWDLVVVDTPPTRAALDFLEASGRLTRFLDHKLFRVLVGQSPTGLRPVQLAARGLLRSIGRVVGAEVLADAMAFFEVFEGMEEGFRQRAAAVQALLTDVRTGYVVVASARADTVSEAGWFVERLAALGVPVGALVLNRMTPAFGAGSAAEARTRAGAHWENVADLRALREGERRHVEGLAARVAPAPVVQVPMLAHDVADIDALAEIAALLLPEV